MLRFLYIPLLMSIMSFPASAEVSIDEDFIFLWGSITVGDAVTVITSNPGKISTLVLNSSGGNYVASKEIALWVRRNKIDTVVDHGDGCYSGCSLIFQAGYPNRLAGKDAMLGYHPVSVQFDDVRLAHPMSTREIIGLYRIYGMKKECTDKIPSLKVNDWYAGEANTFTHCNIVTQFIPHITEASFNTTPMTRSVPGKLSYDGHP